MNKLSICLALTALLSSQSFAHTKLAESLPADGAVLTESPPALELTFSENVQLLKLDLATDTGTALDIGFAAAATSANTYSVPLPALEPAGYAVSWTVIGADGHRVEGELSFLVDAVAHEPADSASEEEAAESAQDGR